MRNRAKPGPQGSSPMPPIESLLGMPRLLHSQTDEDTLLQWNPSLNEEDCFDVAKVSPPGKGLGA